MADEPVLPPGSPIPDEIVRSVLIHASAEEVFAVIREPGWFINDGEYREHKITRQGAVTQVVDPVHGSFQLAIEAHEPPNRIRFRWLGGGLGEISDAPNNTVEFVIDPRAPRSATWCGSPCASAASRSWGSTSPCAAATTRRTTAAGSSSSVWPSGSPRAEGRRPTRAEHHPAPSSRR